MGTWHYIFKYLLKTAHIEFIVFFSKSWYFIY